MGIFYPASEFHPARENKKGCPGSMDSLLCGIWVQVYTLCLASSETDIFFLPLALRLLSILRPLTVAMRFLKPCLFFLFRLDGWNVLFIAFLV